MDIGRLCPAKNNIVLLRSLVATIIH